MKQDQTMKRGMSDLQKSFFAQFGQEKPKPIPPKLVMIYGYPLAAMISQLLFWYGKGSRKDGYIFKTEKDFIKELGLSSAQQKLAIVKGKEYGFLEVKVKGIPGKRHYRLSYTKLAEVTILEAAKKGVHLVNPPVKIAGKQPQELDGISRSITNNTQINTTRKHKPERLGGIMERFDKRI